MVAYGSARGHTRGRENEINHEAGILSPGSLLEYARRSGIEHDAGEALDRARGGC